MRLIFMGTPDFAVPVFQGLILGHHEVAAVYCQPPRPAGRGKAAARSPVQRWAESYDISVCCPASLRERDKREAFAAWGADAAVVAAYGLILPQPILDAPRLGCFNVHASLLPRWRGAAPVQRAILAGDETTGVTIMRMERGLDTGPMLATAETSVAGKTAGVLAAELAAMGARLMAETLAALPEPVPQPDEGVTYAAKVEKAEARLDFAQPADVVLRQVLAFNPAPGAFFLAGNERIKVLEADPVAVDADYGTVLDDHLTIACGAGAIRPRIAQRAGKAAMTTGELLRGFPIPAGARLA